MAAFAGHSLEELQECLHLDVSGQGAPLPRRPHRACISDFPHQLPLRASRLGACHLCLVENQVGVLPLWVILPLEPL